ncbi:MAG: hypothetical protein F6K00_34655 [Leptolyngbya sp. SIOISBB]|nr:hypothetical protein [Leptolyngbya sp. SIOISBB]
MLFPRVAVDADGSIQLIGSNTTVSTDTGTNLISGVISTSGETGGSITVVGDRVGLLGADLNASGMEGGGDIRIGGDYQGQGDISNASRTLIDANSTIAADALLNGDGGRVIIWANEATRFDGRISAQGGTQSGNGGFVEVSGLNFLDFQGSADTSASNGEFGSLLLDPTDIEIVETGGTASLEDVLAADLNPGTRSVINADLINAAVGDVILQATNDIIFSADINIAAFGIGLIANAGNDIDVNSNITTNGGDVVLNGNFDGVEAGAVSIQNSEINTLGGNLHASGQAGAGSLGNDGVEIGGGKHN